MSDYVVNIQQEGAKQYANLFLSQKGVQFEFSIATAGIFGYKEALKLANKMKDRFTVINNLVPPPPAGLVRVYIIEVGINYNIISETEI